MPHRFGPRKGPPRKDRAEDASAEQRPSQDAPGKELLGEALLGKDLLSENLLGKDLPVLGNADKPRQTGMMPRKSLPRKGVAHREVSSGGDLPWLYIVGGVLVLAAFVVALLVGYSKSQVPGYTSDIAVEQPSRLDWGFVVSESGQSGEPPALWSFFESQRYSRYELYVPPSYDASAKKSYPLVMFLSPTERPDGWSRWSQVCQEQEIIFAGVRDAGRSKPHWQQVRIALDVLDDVRRHYRIDTDRCYVAGLGEGGQLACELASAMPEVFGGVIAIDSAAFLRDESWLRQRVIDRLSVAVVSGEQSEDRYNVQKVFIPYFEQIGIRAKSWIVPGLADRVPSSDQLTAIYAWLEEGAPNRQELAKRFPATRFGGDEAPDPDQLSKRMLEEAKQRVGDPATLYSGVLMLRGIAHRWEGNPFAIEAGKILGEKFADRTVFEEQQKADQLRFGLPVARGLTAYLTSDIPQIVFDRNWQRNVMWTSKATNLWKQLAALKPDLADEADKALAQLENVLSKRPTSSR